MNTASSPSATGDASAETVTSGNAASSSSTRTIRPSPFRLPSTPRAVPEATGTGISTVTVSSSASASSEAASARNASDAPRPLAEPVKVTVPVPASNATPVEAPSIDSVKSVPGWPPENTRGTRRLSPAVNPELPSRVSRRCSRASSLGFPSAALASRTDNVTVSGWNSGTSGPSRTVAWMLLGLPWM